MRCTLHSSLMVVSVCLLIGCQRAAPPAPTSSAGSAAVEATQPAEAATESAGAQPPSTAAAAATGSRGFESPEAAFAAMQGALKQKDWQTAAGCMTDESQEVMSTGLLLAGGLMAAFGGDQASELTAVLEKHGVETPEPAFNFSPTPPGETPDSEPDEPAEDMPDIKDKAAFISDMLTALEAMDEGGSMQKHEQWAEATLKDLTLDGDSATATLTLPGDDGEESQELAFRRGEGGWLVHLSEEILAGGPGGPGGGMPSTFGDDPEPEGPLTETVLEGGLTSTLSLTFEPPFTQQFFDAKFPDRTLFATLSLTGEPILNAYEYGEFTLDSVTDDTGAALDLAAPIKDQFDNEFGDVFVELNDFFLDNKDTLPIVFALTPPAADAKTITIQGSCKLKVRESLIVKDVMNSMGGELKDDQLAELGTFTLKKPGEDDGEPGHGLVLEVKAPEGTVEGITLLDGEGQPLETAAGTYSFGFGDEMTFGINTSEALPADTQLRLTLGGTESIQVVPLNIESAELPQ